VDAPDLAVAARAGDELAAGEVSAGEIRRVCREHAAEVDPRGLRIRGARITGPLDLAGFRLPFPLSFVDCRFTDPVRLDGTEVHAVALTGSTLPGLLANGIRVGRDLDLSGATIRGAHATAASTTRKAAVWLCESDIGGRLLGVDTTIDGAGERAVQADRMHVGGTIRFLHEFTARGEIRLLGVRVDGSIDLTGAHLAEPGGLALDIADCEVGGSVHLIGSRRTGAAEVLGRIDANSTRISGRLMLRDIHLTKTGPRPDDPYWRRHQEHTALSAARLHVRNEVSIEGGCVIDGGLDLSFAELGNVVVASGARVAAPGVVALDFSDAELRAGLLIEPGVAVEGSLRLTGARLAGNLTLRGTSWSRPFDQRAVRASGSRIGGDVSLQGMRTTNAAVAFRAAEIGGAFDATGAHLHNPADRALILHQAVAHGSIRLVDGFRADGYTVLNRITVDGRLDLRGGTFHCTTPSDHNPHGDAIGAYSATVRGGMHFGWASVSPSIDLTGARTTVLADDPGNWPARYGIAGFGYDRFAAPDEVDPRPAWDWRARVRWLAGQSGFDAGSYEQVARVLRQHGYTGEAERVLIAQRDRAARIAPDGPDSALRKGKRLLLRGAGWAFGYGYRPWRALWMLVVLFLLVLLTAVLPPTQRTLRASDEQGDVYATSGLLLTTTGTAPPRSDPCGNGQVRCFNPVFFAVDTVVPLVSLDQRATWYPDREAPGGRFVDVWLDLATILGWILSSVFVLSFTRLVRNGPGQAS
jgi:hypothetical protein